jgi:membrane fusion protein (multidrug efflux system)
MLGTDIAISSARPFLYHGGKNMTKRRKAFTALTAIAVVLIGVAAMFLLTSFKAEAAKTEQIVEIRTVKTRVLIPGPQTVSIESDGFIKPARSLDIYSSLAGRVAESREGLKGGTRVAEGDVLLLLDDRRARLAFESARTDLVSSASRFITSAGLDDENRAAWSMFINVLSGADFGSLPELPSGNHRLELLAATMGVKDAQHSLESAALDLADHQMLAPFAGTISGEGVLEGAWVSPGVSLGTIIETGRMELPLSLPSGDLIQVESGDRVTISRPKSNDFLFGEVVRIEPLLSAGSQTTRVHVAFESPEGWIPGSFVNATIEGRRIESAYRVPRGILVNDRLPAYVDGHLALLPVKVLARDIGDLLLAPDIPEGTEMVETVLQSPIEGLPISREGSK